MQGCVYSLLRNKQPHRINGVSRTNWKISLTGGTGINGPLRQISNCMDLFGTNIRKFCLASTHFLGLRAAVIGNASGHGHRHPRNTIAQNLGLIAAFKTNDWGYHQTGFCYTTRHLWSYSMANLSFIMQIVLEIFAKMFASPTQPQPAVPFLTKNVTSNLTYMTCY